MKKADNTNLKFARKLRSNQTDAEKLLWHHLRSKRLIGFKFRRQQLIGEYIVDFVCYEKKLIIELDGGQHNKESGKRTDEIRTKWFTRDGYLTLRFWNNEVTTNTDGTLDKIRQIILRRFSPPRPIPLPRGERET